jgi:hypothetical protein
MPIAYMPRVGHDHLHEGEILREAQNFPLLKKNISLGHIWATFRRLENINAGPCSANQCDEATTDKKPHSVLRLTFMFWSHLPLHMAS